MLFDLSPYLSLNSFIALWLVAAVAVVLIFGKKDF